MSSRGGPRAADTELLRWVAALGAVSADSLAHRQDVSLASARGRLSAGARAGLMRRWRPLVEEPALYTLTAAGLACAGMPALTPLRISPAGARHSVACAHVAVRLERAYPNRRLIGESLLRRDRRWAIALGGSAATHRPDLVMLEGRAGVAVEVELTVKAPRRLEAICKAWSRSRSFGGILYVVSREARQPVLRAIDSAGAGERIVVLEMAGLPETAAERTVTAGP